MTIEKIFPAQYEPGSIADQYIKKGRQEGLKEGEIHLIQTLQEILGLPLSDGATLEDRSLEQLQAITGELRQQFRDRKWCCLIVEELSVFFRQRRYST